MRTNTLPADPDLTTLALGTDLTTLGLNLNSPEALWKTFASPWADGPGKPEPDFKVGGAVGGLWSAVSGLEVVGKDMTFASPWADGPGKPEPDFKVGGCRGRRSPSL